MDNTENITVLSLCSGYGGLELGLSRALANTLRVVAVEIEAYAMANLVAKAEEGKLAVEALYPDLKTFPAERFSGCFDFVLAGYPCQPFSVAGQRKGAEDPRHLWPHIARIMQAVRPVWGFFENVPGHLNLGFGEVYCSLRDMGYSVEAGLFTAAEVGAPHKRQRLFILAYQPEPERAAQTGGQVDEYGRTLWPARPGQPQYEWEEPRVVVGDAGHVRAGKRRRAGQEHTERPEDNIGEAQSDVGGTTNGPAYRVDATANRVDRLRLLGNGVVPQQAEKAFRMLWCTRKREEERPDTLI